MTKRPGSRERSLISWSLIPSLKYSCLRVAAQIGERQHRDRRNARQWQRWLLLRRNRCVSTRRLERQMLHQHDCPDDDRQPRQRQHATSPIPSRQIRCVPRDCGAAPSSSTRQTCTGSRDVLDRLLAEVFVGQRKLVSHLRRGRCPRCRCRRARRDSPAAPRRLPRRHRSARPRPSRRRG